MRPAATPRPSDHTRRGPPARRLIAAGETVAAAESLTAGLFCATPAGVPGASATLRGGVVVHATELQGRVFLGVSDGRRTDVVALDLPGQRADVHEGAVGAAVAALLARVTSPRNARAKQGVTP